MPDGDLGTSVFVNDIVAFEIKHIQTPNTLFTIDQSLSDTNTHETMTYHDGRTGRKKKESPLS